MLKLVIFVVALGVGAQAIDWCQMQTTYCKGKEHIACEPNSFTDATNVRNVKLVTMTPEIQKMIVDRHNEYRSKVALGKESGIPSATNMYAMKWDDNLAYVASQHAKHAKMQHDQCRAFTDYPYSGQNLASGSSSAPISDVTAAIKKHIDMWYNDEMPIVRDQMPSCTGKFTSSPNCLQAGHYTAVVHGDSGAVGCASVTFEQQISGNWWYSVMTTCNYEGNNMSNQPVYTAGTTCSGCAAAGRTCDAARGLCV
ncbi:antigen 5 like allergen Cul n 1-like [Lutzomyia longipalpis]|uniref:antigen 5 like allergen Cul n 1-like n=1 Tax=Lutzomyia longipalpis TaxID=7200 RepID=UPI0024844993|nr:antigen 5 like allergen Cul n 1-like [Lutzomyia longipalpis]